MNISEEMRKRMGLEPKRGGNIDGVKYAEIERKRQRGAQTRLTGEEMKEKWI